LFLLFITFLLGILPSKARASEPWNIKWEPTQLVNGSPVLFRVSAPAELTSLEGTWLGHALQFRFGQSCNCWYALAGVDLNGDGVSNNDYVPGTTRNLAGRDSASTARVLELVNAWRAVRNLAPIPASQLQSSNFNRFDIRLSRSIGIPGGRNVDLVAQVFNVFGRDNLIGGTGGGAVNFATSNAFGKYTIAAPRQDVEVGISFKF